jgi:hypothetical protein
VAANTTPTSPTHPPISILARQQIEKVHDGEQAISASAASQLSSATLTSSVTGNTILDVLGKDMRRFENNIVGRLEKMLQIQNARIEKDRAERDKTERERQERLLTVISQTLNTNLQQNMERIVRKELQTMLIPALEKGMASGVESLLVKPLHDTLKKSFQVRLSLHLQPCAFLNKTSHPKLVLHYDCCVLGQKNM